MLLFLVLLNFLYLLSKYFARNGLSPFYGRCKITTNTLLLVCELFILEENSKISKSAKFRVIPIRTRNRISMCRKIRKNKNA